MTLSRILLAGTFLAGISAPGLAADLGQAPVESAPVASMVPQGISGYVDLYGGLGIIDFDFEGGEYDLGLIGGAGRANIWLSPAVALQLDAWGDSTAYSLDGEDFDISYTAFGIGGHLAWRDPNRYAFGGLVSFGDAAVTRWGNIGAEGQVYFGNFTLYGQAGYTFSIAGQLAEVAEVADIDAWYVVGEGRFFPMPNFMLAGHLGYDDFSCNGCGGDFSAVRWGLDAEFQPGGWPVAGFLSYQGGNFDFSNTGGADIDEHVFLAGVKVLLGQDSLQENNNYGATFADHNPVYGKWNLRTIGLLASF